MVVFVVDFVVPQTCEQISLKGALLYLLSSHSECAFAEFKKCAYDIPGNCGRVNE